MKKNSLVDILKKAVGIPAQDSECCKPEIPANLKPADDVKTPVTAASGCCGTPAKEA